MSKLRLIISGLLLLLFTISAQARTNIDLSVAIATPPPPTRVVVAPPGGFTQCFLTNGEWVGNMWVPPHQECSYPNQANAVWISGYWGCIEPGPGGSCEHWKWVDHRWSRGPGFHHMGYGYGHGYHDMHERHFHHDRSW